MPSVVIIDKLVAGGWGLARLESMVTFIREVILGEKVLVETGRRQKDFQQGTINEILEASVDRLQPACSVYGVCGGCQFQHLKYEAQLIKKGNLLYETLSRLGR